MFQDLIGRISAHSPEMAVSGLEAVSGGIMTASKTDSLGSLPDLLESFSHDPAKIDVWGDPNVVQPQGWAQFQEPVGFLTNAKTPPDSPYSFADVAQNLQDGEFNQASVLSDVFDSFFGDQGSLSSLIGNVFGNLAARPPENSAAAFDNPFADVMLNPQPLPPKEGSSQESLSSFDDLASKLSGSPGGFDEQGMRTALADHAGTIQDFQSIMNDSVNLQQDFRFRGGFRI
jgi:hypothetical protein